MSGAIGSAATRLITRSFSRGRRGSGLWLALGVFTWGLRQVYRLSRRQDETVFSQVLNPGESFSISHLTEEFGTSDV